MGDQVVLLVLGFILTTVLGGLLGYVFQRRAWSHQFEVQRSVSERDAASSALEELSTLLDKRRYRMLLIYWQLEREDPEEFERRVSAYRAVLEEWNDGLNRRLALVATHFGSDLKRELEGLYETYREAGDFVDAGIREKRAGGALTPLGNLVELLEGLNQRNYRFAETGLSLILAGHVGSNMTAGQRRPTPTPPVADVRTTTSAS
jgi:hypothetical protein